MDGTGGEVTVPHPTPAGSPCPNGGAAKRELVRHPGAVAIVPLIGDDVLMVRQFRMAAGRIMLEIPAGRVSALFPIDTR